MKPTDLDEPWTEAEIREPTPKRIAEQAEGISCAKGVGVTKNVEKWQFVPGYEGLYEVSDQGRVRSLDHMRRDGRFQKGRILKPWYSCGYPWVTLTKNGNQKKFAIHRLVLTTFVGPMPEGLITRHLNGIKVDNRLVNLKYGTQSENAYDKSEHGGNHNANKTHCLNGHEYTPENTVIVRDNFRNCRQCMYERISRYQASREAKSRQRGLSARPNTPDEQWRPVVGYEGHYSVSDQGRVRSEPRLDGRGRRIKGRILKGGVRGGYPQVNLAMYGVQSMHDVHRLVLTAFVGPQPEGQVVRHLNDDPCDNWLDNLEYGTTTQNAADRVRNQAKRAN